MKYRNSFAEYKNLLIKNREFNRARNAGGFAYKQENGDLLQVPLSRLKLSDVEFVAGIWRVQNKFDHKIILVRDRRLVLGTRLPKQERNLFEYYNAYSVCENCYGIYIPSRPDTIVAKYETDGATYWSYGSTIEQARAFLGIKLYDEYMNLIHSVACKKMLHNNEK